MRIPNINELFEDRNLATFMLMFMSVQFIFIEGMTISIPKVAFMSIMPLIWLVKFPYPTKALLYGFSFLLVTMMMCEINGNITRYSTFIYTALFLFTFTVYYNLVWIKECFTLNYFQNLVKWMIFGYTICLLLQQGCILVGIRNFPLINLVGAGYYSVNHLNTLAIEPSQAARIMTVFFYTFLKCTEYQNNQPLGIKDLYKNYKWVIISFIYFMIFIGSGTAMVGVAVIALYFVKKKYAFFILFVGLMLYIVSPYIDYAPYNRAIDTLNAAITGDKEDIINADHSASTRVNIILDTLTKTDLADSQTWIGHGMEAEREYTINRAIYDYGLISYVIKITFFMTCCFTAVFSLETLMFVLLFGMNIGNIAYGWAALMTFTTLKYFKAKTKSDLSVAY